MAYTDNSMSKLLAMLHNEWSAGNLMPVDEATKAKLEKAQRLVTNKDLNPHIHANPAMRSWKK